MSKPKNTPNNNKDAPDNAPKATPTNFSLTQDGINAIANVIEEMLDNKPHTKKAIYNVINEHLKPIID